MINFTNFKTKENNNSNSVKNDIAEIKNSLKEINKTINILKNIIMDDYFNEDIIEFYNNEDK